MKKTIETLVCDFPHKHDVLATHEQVKLDLCSIHFKLFENVEQTIECPDCGRRFRTAAGLRKHQTDAHGAPPATKKAAAKRTTRRRAAKRTRARR